MGRESSRGGGQPPSKIEAVPALVEDILFQPNRTQEMNKARLWTRLSQNPLLIPEELSMTQVSEILGSRALEPHWNKPGFRDWLMNRTEHRERIEFLFSRALDAAEGSLLSDDPKTANAKVNVLKILAELAAKYPTAATAQKDVVADMSKEQLEEFLSKNGVRIEKPTNLVIDVTEKKD